MVDWKRGLAGCITSRALFVFESSDGEVVFKKQWRRKKTSHPGILYDEAVGGETKPARGNNKKYFQSSHRQIIVLQSLSTVTVLLTFGEGSSYFL